MYHSHPRIGKIRLVVKVLDKILNYLQKAGRFTNFPIPSTFLLRSSATSVVKRNDKASMISIKRR